MRASFTLPEGAVIENALVLIDRGCIDPDGVEIPQTYAAVVQGTSIICDIRTPIYLSAFFDITLEARLEYRVPGNPTVFLASDTITITVMPISVVIDPGHGSLEYSPRGTTGPSTDRDGNPIEPLEERFLTLDLGFMSRDRLAFIGPNPPIVVTMTREADVSVSRSTRVNISHEKIADIFVSLHFNSPKDADDHTTNGTETWIRSSGPTATKHQRSGDYAALLVDEISSEIGTHNRGVKLSGGLGVLINNERPAVITESSFLTSWDEQERLRNPAYLGRIADAHERAIREGNKLRPRFRDQRNPNF